MIKPTIICVDDEPVILHSLKGQLDRSFSKKFSFGMVESGIEAHELLDELINSGIEVPMIIVGQLMPGMKGSEVLERVHSKYATIRKVMLTGQADTLSVGKALNKGGLYRFLSKPWREEDLKLTVQEGVKSFFKKRKLSLNTVS